jgi:hypothetical protein
MNPRKAAAFGIILMISQAALADASYENTTQITGGSMVEQMKQLSFLSKSLKDMFAPTTTTTMVSGNRKVVVSKESTEITDLDKETITRVDNQKKTYTVMTFAQMRQMLKDMPAQMEKAKAQMAQAQAQQPKSDLKMSFDSTVKNTGVTKMINGLMAEEQVITVNTHMSDPNAPSSGPSSITMTVTTDTWVAPDPPEMKEIQDFDVRMGKKLMEGMDAAEMKAEMESGAAMAQMFAGKPGSAESMAQMGKEMNKLKGTRVMEITSMSGLGPVGMPATAGAPAAPPPSGGSVAGQVASDTATQTAQGEQSKMGVFGSALTNSALNAFHRKKTPPPAPPPAPAATTTSTAPVGTTSVVLMATTTQKTNFSQNAVPASAFQIPAGFKQIAYVNPMDRMGK